MALNRVIITRVISTFLLLIALFELVCAVSLLPKPATNVSHEVDIKKTDIEKNKDDVHFENAKLFPLNHNPLVVDGNDRQTSGDNEDEDVEEERRRKKKRTNGKKKKNKKPTRTTTTETPFNAASKNGQMDFDDEDDYGEEHGQFEQGQFGHGQFGHGQFGHGHGHGHEDKEEDGHHILNSVDADDDDVYTKSAVRCGRFERCL